MRCARRCLHSYGFQEFVGALLLGVGRGGHFKSGEVCVGTGDPAEIAHDGAEVMKQRLEAMHVAAVVEGVRMHLA